MDHLFIDDLAVQCRIGVQDAERASPQTLLISVLLDADLRDASRSDRLDDTIDYSRLKKELVALADESRCCLIETLAEKIADLCLSHPRVHHVRVRIVKPSVAEGARRVGIELERPFCA